MTTLFWGAGATLQFIVLRWADSHLGMRLDKGFRAVISMRIDAPIGLPKDSSASIHTDGLFGSKFVVMEPGAEETVLKSGDEIRYTQDALVVSDLMELIISEGKSARAEADKAAGQSQGQTQGQTKTN